MDIYQWVQFNRAIINARESRWPNYRKYRPAAFAHRRLEHESICQRALKDWDDRVVFIFAGEGRLPRNLVWLMQCKQRDISRDTVSDGCSARERQDE